MAFSNRTGLIAKGLLAAAWVSLFGMISPSQAHVKWFAPYLVAQQPIPLHHVIDMQFILLNVLAISALLLGAAIEYTAFGKALLGAFDSVTSIIQRESDKLVRAVLGGFLISLWAHGGIILTPELKTTWSFISWLQLAMAVSLIWEETMIFAAAGIFFLYGYALTKYSVFHLLDYPIFLGLAIFIGAKSLKRKVFGLEPLDVARWLTGLTLLWASIEKFAYPEWSYPLAVTHPGLTFGFSRGFFMCAAGVVEFALAFSLLWTPLVRRVGATILIGMFTSAVVPFGKIDAIGHSCIIVLLMVIVSDQRQEALKPLGFLRVGLQYAMALLAYVGVYYGLHAAIYGTEIM